MGFKLVSIKGIQGDKDKWLQYIEENLDFFVFNCHSITQVCDELKTDFLNFFKVEFEIAITGN